MSCRSVSKAVTCGLNYFFSVVYRSDIYIYIWRYIRYIHISTISMHDIYRLLQPTLAYPVTSYKRDWSLPVRFNGTRSDGRSCSLILQTNSSFSIYCSCTSCSLRSHCAGAQQPIFSPISILRYDIGISAFLPIHTSLDLRKSTNKLCGWLQPPRQY